MAHDQEVEDDELEVDEEGFAGPATGRRQEPQRTTDGPAPGGSFGRNGNGEDGVQAELARLRSEVARLKAVAGLEGRRDEPATVGDVLDANEAQIEFIRAEVERAVAERGDKVAEYIAACVEERLLEPLGLDTANDDDRAAASTRTAKRKPSSTQLAKRRRGLRKGELFYEADGSGPFVFNGDEDDEVDDDGRRRAFA
jgi:hypothetical protein